jgi:epoxyqueuosine reductase
MSSIESHTAIIKALAKRIGFSFCGISEAVPLDEESARLESWLRRGYQGSMRYLENHREMRLDPRELVPGAKSVVSLAYNYFPRKMLPGHGTYKIAKYAYGADYHKVLRKKLKRMLREVHARIGEVHGRAFVDSAPVMERQWAAKSGLGWIGKNGLLLNRGMGSFFFLCELIIDLPLVPDGPIGDYCGTCTRCLDACPTQAFPQPGVLDASKCISYLTIELKDSIPHGFHGRMDDWIFGCDVCQDVCPWNRFSKPSPEEAFYPGEQLKKMQKRDWEEITEEIFNRIFAHSPLKRAGYEGIRNSIAANKKVRK